MERIILHCDCNSFYASVELLKYPDLRDTPVAVCGDPKSRRGIILAKNEPAKAFGIKTAETIWSAKKKCKDLVLLPAHHHEYAKYSSLINEIYYSYTDLVEPFGIDESWLDVTGSIHLFGGDPQKLADEIRERVKKELGLTLSIGVSFNKVFAKLGSDYKKPDATTLIFPQHVETIVHPLKIDELLFVGKNTAQTLNAHGIYTIGELSKASPLMLEQLLGKHGKSLSEYSRGEDSSPVRSFTDKEDIKSVGNGTTFPKDLSDFESINSVVISLCDTVSMRLRKYKLKCSTVQVMIKFPNFKSISRQAPLAEPTHMSKDIATFAMEIITSAIKYGTAVRSVTVTALNLTDEEMSFRQTSLFSDTPEQNLNDPRREKLEKAMFSLKDKYGNKSLVHGFQVKKDDDEK